MCLAETGWDGDLGRDGMWRGSVGKRNLHVVAAAVVVVAAAAVAAAAVVAVVVGIEVGGM